MTADEIRAVIVDSVCAIAPDVADEVGDLAGDADLWDELELDSMDQLNVVVAVHDKTGVEIPERDYGQLRSLDAFTAYVQGASS